jgi:hypothetical protein
MGALAIEEGSVAAGRVCAALSIPKYESRAKTQTVAPDFIRVYTGTRRANRSDRCNIIKNSVPTLREDFTGR